MDYTEIKVGLLGQIKGVSKWMSKFKASFEYEWCFVDIAISIMVRASPR